jgi:NTP pyrophosphatase (non-canonical NTP hydrolase)
MTTENTQDTLKIVFAAVEDAHQKRVDASLVPAIQYNEAAALTFAYHLVEEAMELVQEFSCRKQWKSSTPVDIAKATGEAVDVMIMLIIVCKYLEIDSSSLLNGVITKLGTKRPDWLI